MWPEILSQLRPLRQVAERMCKMTDVNYLYGAHGVIFEGRYIPLETCGVFVGHSLHPSLHNVGSKYEYPRWGEPAYKSDTRIVRLRDGHEFRGQYTGEEKTVEFVALNSVGWPESYV